MTEKTESLQRPLGGVLPLPTAETIVRRLGLMIAILVLASLGSDGVRFFADGPVTWGGNALAVFDLDYEDSVPTWFQVLLLAAIGGLVLVWKDDLGAGQHGRWGWPVLGVTFLLLSLDEMASLHERLIDVLAAALEIRSGPFFFAWVIPGTVLVVLFVAGMVPMLRALPGATRMRFLVAGAVFVAGALGAEMVGGTMASTIGQSNVPYNIVTTLEETLEMVGALLFLRGVLLHRAAVSGATEGAQAAEAAVTRTRRP